MTFWNDSLVDQNYINASDNLIEKIKHQAARTPRSHDFWHDPDFGKEINEIIKREREAIAFDLATAAMMIQRRDTTEKIFFCFVFIEYYQKRLLFKRSIGKRTRLAIFYPIFPKEGPSCYHSFHVDLSVFGMRKYDYETAWRPEIKKLPLRPVLIPDPNIDKENFHPISVDAAKIIKECIEGTVPDMNRYRSSSAFEPIDALSHLTIASLKRSFATLEDIDPDTDIVNLYP